MKTKCIFAAIMAIVAVGTIVCYHNQTKKSIQSDLALENIEALTNPEAGEITPDCSTEYNGEYCGSVEIGGVSFPLYYPKTI